MSWEGATLGMMLFFFGGYLIGLGIKMVRQFADFV